MSAWSLDSELSTCYNVLIIYKLCIHIGLCIVTQMYTCLMTLLAQLMQMSADVYLKSKYSTIDTILLLLINTPLLQLYHWITATQTGHPGHPSATLCETSK